MDYIYSPSMRLAVSELSSCAKKLEDYRARLQRISKEKKYEHPESSLCLPDDTKLFSVVQTCARKTNSSKLRYVFVIGIGGSNLGTKAVYDALRGYRDTIAHSHSPKLLFVDTLQSEWIADLRVICKRTRDPKELLIVIACKSGTTTETIAAAETLLSSLGDISRFSKRIVAITDRESPLWQRGSRHGWHTLEIPKSVGGRFSLFSPVGLFPLIVAGFDVRALRQGALSMREACLQKSFAKNPALLSAAYQYLNYANGYIVHDTFLFAPRLESAGKWYRQLLGESIGKEYDIRRRRVHVGIIPTISIGSIDLHSMGQLYLGGPKKVITTFVRIAYAPNIRVPGRGTLHGIVSGIGSRSLSVIMDALLDGTQAAYRKSSLPYSECILRSISEKELGAFFQWKMLEVMYLAQLFGVNAFDQPNVESYKEESRRRLG